MRWISAEARLAITLPPRTPDPSQPAGPAQATGRLRQASPELHALLATLDAERAAMKRALGIHPANVPDLQAGRRALLRSLEAYVAALGKSNLPVPPRLRDELSLQRGLAANRRGS